MVDTKRALLVTRLSALTDESTSPKRQKDQTTAVANTRGSIIVGHAEDLDISAGKYTPWERPQLGPWLTERADEFDEIIVWRLDRLVRSVYDLSIFVKWCEENDKSLISATEPFDLGTPLGRILIVLIAAFAEMELNAIRERVLSSRAELRTTSRWGGGPAPYGWRSIDNPDKEVNGKILVPDTLAATEINDLLAEIEVGKSPNSLTNKLNERGVLSPAERQRELLGKPLGDPKKLNPDGSHRLAKWTRSAVVDILTSQSLLGVKMQDIYIESANSKNKRKKAGREPIRDKNGLPVRFADPIVSPEQFWNVQRILAERSFTRSRTNGAAMLLDVAYCECGHKEYKALSWVKGTGYHYYRCGNKNCPYMGLVPRGRQAKGPDRYSRSWRAEKLENFVSEQFLMAAGPIEMTRRIFIPGSTHQAEMEEIKSAVEYLTEQQVTSGPLQRSVIQSMMSAHETRYSELSALPVVKPHWKIEGLGVTYGERWEMAWNAKHSHTSGNCRDVDGKNSDRSDCAMTESDRDPDTEELRTLLLLSGIRFTLNRREETYRVSHLASDYLEKKLSGDTEPMSYPKDWPAIELPNYAREESA